MFKQRIVLCIILLALALLAVVSAPPALTTQASGTDPPAQQPHAQAAALDTEFTYQGQLNLDDQPVDDTCDFQFALYDDELGNTQVGATQTITQVQVSGGLFTARLDFGASAFQGDARWLGIRVQCQGDTEYADLGLQALSATPYALYALSAPWNGIGDVPAGFADGIDDVSTVVSGTAVYAGEGLDQIASGDAVTLSVAPSYRLPQACAGGQIAEWDGAAWLCGDDDSGGGSGDDWSLTGNASTDPTSHFLGTSDGVSLTLAVSGTPALRLVPTGGTPSLIGGSVHNTVTLGLEGVVIGGGGSSADPNRALAGYATVGGGADNAAAGNAATVGGGWGNTANGGAATVGGGTGNAASSGYATTGGGWGNAASGYIATIGGGRDNAASGSHATVGGGYGNDAGGTGAFIGGGGYDESTYDGNVALGDASTIGGGLGNVITTTATYAIIGGGYENTASDQYAAVGGGRGNDVSDSYATVGGGRDNAASGSYATVGGGQGNEVSGNQATISGGEDNLITATHGTIAGGYQNVVTGTYGTVGGGRNNSVGDTFATIGGGWNNAASSYVDTVGGGRDNTASGSSATVGGGWGNTASSRGATVGGGDGNTASGDWFPTVGGGHDNTASGYAATVPGGRDNVASGNYSFAAGRRAQANNQGCFVWGDSTNADVTCSNDNRAIFRSGGGYYIYTNSDLTSGMYLVAGGSAWNAVSNRDLKENFAAVDTQQLVARLAQIDIGTWNYKAQDPSIRHIGPMAHDFNALLEGLGGEGLDHINSLDADGIALAAIQGLYAQNQALQQQVNDLKARLSALEAGNSAASPLRADLLTGAGLLLVGGVGLWLVRRRENQTREKAHIVKV